jgi:hypothetical protein
MFTPGSLAVTTLTLSMASLVLLLVVYFLLPQLRNVPGVIVMSYSSSLLVSQVGTVIFCWLLFFTHYITYILLIGWLVGWLLWLLLLFLLFSA